MGSSFTYRSFGRGAGDTESRAVWSVLPRTFGTTDVPGLARRIQALALPALLGPRDLAAALAFARQTNGHAVRARVQIGSVAVVARQGYAQIDIDAQLWAQDASGAESRVPELDHFAAQLVMNALERVLCD